MNKLVFTYIIFLLILVSCHKDDDGLKLNAGELTLKIVDNAQQPIAGAMITIGLLSGETDAKGEYVFENLPAIEHEIAVTKPSYLANTLKIKIAKGKTTVQEITLETDPSYVRLKLVHYEGILGNKERGIQDSIRILFSKPVTVERIENKWEFCQPPLNFTQTADSTGLRFTFSCAELGGQYPFSITVKDADGTSITEHIAVSFYHAKFDLGGFITDMLLINEDKELLISAFNPSRILRYSIESNAVLQTYDLASIMSPIKLSFNPYNGKVYVLGNTDPKAEYRYTGVNRPDVYTLNYHTGEIALAFTVAPDEKDHPEHPTNIPYAIGFTKTGLGVILLNALGSSAQRWQLIDSSKKDKTYAYPHLNASTDPDYPSFVNMWMNHDQSKLLLQQDGGSVKYGVFNGSTGQLSFVRPSSATRSYSVTPHKKTDTFFIRQLYDQFIMDLSGNLSKISYLDSRQGGNADFSYRNKEQNIIYLCEAESYIGAPNSFMVLDYKTSTTLKSCDVIDGLQEFSTTINGKYGVAYRKNSDISSSIYVFLTDTFYSHIK